MQILISRFNGVQDFAFPALAPGHADAAGPRTTLRWQQYGPSFFPATHSSYELYLIKKFKFKYCYYSQLFLQVCSHVPVCLP